MVHENEYWESSSFVTLTYNNTNLPADGNLDPKELSNFIKRLRRYLEPHNLAYYAAGEYGEAKGRPHYHLILYGIEPCRECWVCSKIHRARDVPPEPGTHCDLLEKAWMHQGFVDSRGVGWDSARYVADYVQKDTRPEAYSHMCIDESTIPWTWIETPNRRPPFNAMSGGIGKKWVQDNWRSLMKNFRVNYRGSDISLPRYYQKILAECAVGYSGDWWNLQQTAKWLMQSQTSRRTQENRFEQMELELKDRHRYIQVGHQQTKRRRQREQNQAAKDGLKGTM